jgi:hypothetical protein
MMNEIDPQIAPFMVHVPVIPAVSTKRVPLFQP